MNRDDQTSLHFTISENPSTLCLHSLNYSQLRLGRTVPKLSSDQPKVLASPNSSHTWDFAPATAEAAALLASRYLSAASAARSLIEVTLSLSEKNSNPVVLSCGFVSIPTPARCLSPLENQKIKPLFRGLVPELVLYVEVCPNISSWYHYTSCTSFGSMGGTRQRLHSDLLDLAQQSLMGQGLATRCLSVSSPPRSGSSTGPNFPFLSDELQLLPGRFIYVWSVNHSQSGPSPGTSLSWKTLPDPTAVYCICALNIKPVSHITSQKPLCLCHYIKMFEYLHSLLVLSLEPAETQFSRIQSKTRALSILLITSVNKKRNAATTNVMQS